MELEYRPLVLPIETQILVKWLTDDEWPYHSVLRVSPERVLELIGKGFYSEPNHLTFWIVDPDTQEKIGLIRLFDLEDIGDGSPLFDLRIKHQYRGQGIGLRAVQWLTSFLFEKWPELRRIEGTTRFDNEAMRTIFKKCGYVKEGHYRKSWPAGNGERLDTVQYAILREDWVSGVPTLVSWND